jgi:hypothetical protein
MILLLLAALQDLSGRDLINSEIRRTWDAAEIRPAATSDDAEFLRRCSLDVAGTIPSLEEAERFLADSRPDKRERLVDSLLASEAGARNWSQIWAAAILGTGDVRFQDDVAAKLPRRLQEYFSKNLPLDRFAREVVAFRTPPPSDPKQERDGLSMFYTELMIRQGKEAPQSLAGKFSRVFLGRSIACARCHDHPFDEWTQDDFYGMAAFFAGATHQAYGVGERAAGQVKGLAIPDSKRPPIPASFLDSGEKPRKEEPLRDAFARILTDNPQFARACVNRVWASFFGRGLAPEAAGPSRKPTHPELLDGLARDFQSHGFDLRWLIREICASEAYQLGSRAKSRAPEAERLFAVAPIRALRAEQLVESMLTATGLDTEPRREKLLREFRATLGHDHGIPGTRYQGGIPSALLLLNGTLTAEGTAPAAPTLKRILESQPDVRVDRIYLATLSRPPTAQERRRAAAVPPADLMAALLNSAEFLLSH